MKTQKNDSSIANIGARMEIMEDKLSVDDRKRILTMNICDSAFLFCTKKLSKKVSKVWINENTES